MTGENKKFNIIVLTLTVAALSLWGSFSQLGEENNGKSVAHHCHSFESAGSRTELIATIILVGLALGFYGVNVDQDSKKLLQSKDKRQALFARIILVVVHTVLAIFIWLMFDTMIDNNTPDCSEFVGRHNMFLCVALIAILVSLLYLLYDIAEHFGEDPGKTAFSALVYGIVTFAFFFYATAPPGESAHVFSDTNQIAWTLGATFFVVVVHLAANYGIICKGTPSEKVAKLYERYKTTFRSTQGLVAFVLLWNLVFSISIIQSDIDKVANDTSSTQSSSNCLSEHDNVLGMKLTAIGYWTLYVILVLMAFVQTLHRIIKVPELYARHGFVFSDTKKGWNMPTSIVALTYVWLLVALIMHGSDFNSSGCTDSFFAEWSIFAAHSIGFLVVCLALPIYYKSKVSLSQGGVTDTVVVTEEQVAVNGSINDGTQVLRPTNRFTTRAQVAVDVNTPLNFA